MDLFNLNEELRVCFATLPVTHMEGTLYHELYQQSQETHTLPFSCRSAGHSGTGTETSTEAEWFDGSTVHLPVF